MINIKELRIGNSVYSNRFKKSIKVNEISENYVKINDYAENLYLIEPIKMTEEWLLKFGFKEDCIGYFFLDVFNSFYGFVEREDLGFMLVIGDIEYKETYVKYVHQLQNLYYALTNKELEIDSEEAY